MLHFLRAYLQILKKNHTVRTMKEKTQKLYEATSLVQVNCSLEKVSMLSYHIHRNVSQIIHTSPYWLGSACCILFTLVITIYILNRRSRLGFLCIIPLEHVPLTAMVRGGESVVNQWIRQISLIQDFPVLLNAKDILPQGEDTVCIFVSR